MIRYMIASILLMLLASGCASRGKLDTYTAEPDTALASFEQNAQTAEWLMFYRHALELAREATNGNSDVSGSKRSAFAWQEGDSWYVSFGELVEQPPQRATYQPSAVYRVDLEAETAIRVSNPEPHPRAVAFMRALQWTYRRVVAPNLENEGLMFDQFVTHDSYDNVMVWIVPGWQPNGYVLHGRTQMYKFTTGGSTVLHQRVWDYGLTGLRPSKGNRYTIGHAGYMYPPVGDLYFILYYGRLFRGVMARTRDYGTTIATVDEVPHWVHMPISGKGDTLVGPTVPLVGPTLESVVDPLE